MPNLKPYYDAALAADEEVKRIRLSWLNAPNPDPHAKTAAEIVAKSDAEIAFIERALKWLKENA